MCTVYFPLVKVCISFFRHFMSGLTVQGIEAVMAVSGVSSKAKERRKLGSCLKDAALRLLGVSQANGVIRSRDMWRDVLLE